MILFIIAMIVLCPLKQTRTKPNSQNKKITKQISKVRTGTDNVQEKKNKGNRDSRFKCFEGQNRC